MTPPTDKKCSKTGYVSYLSKQDAENAALYHQQQHPNGDPQHADQCEYCQDWHLSSKCQKTGKRSFGSEEEAVKFDQLNRRKFGNPPKFAYPCEVCPAWHLSSTPNGNSRIAKPHFPQVPEEPETKEKRPVQTIDVLRMKSEGKTTEEIAKYFGVTTYAIQYHLNKTSTPHIRPKNVVSLDSVSKKKAELEAQQKLLLEQMAKLQAEEERLLENAKMKFEFVQTENQGEVIVIKKNEEEITLTHKDIVQLYESVQQHEVII